MYSLMPTTPVGSWSSKAATATPRLRQPYALMPRSSSSTGSSDATSSSRRPKAVGEKASLSSSHLTSKPSFPQKKGFSTTNLWYMKQWYLFYTTPEALQQLSELSRQPVFSNAAFAHKLHQLGGETTEAIFPQLVEEILQQPVGEFPVPFAMVPWSRHLVILGKCDTPHKALFYIRQIITEGWS